MTTPHSNGNWTDERFDALLAFVLRFGVLMSASVIAVGGAVFLARHGLDRPSYTAFRAEPARCDRSTELWLRPCT